MNEFNPGTTAGSEARVETPAVDRVTSTSSPTPGTKNVDLETIKTRQQATWATGDYGQIGVRLQIVGETLCEAVDLKATERVLDVAAGNGNATLAAARRFAEVTSTDYVPELLEQGRRRAEAERLPATFRVADAESLPFDDASFDVVLSTFGVMFTPDQVRSARELLRVVRPGGRIGLANWTPEGFIGELFRLMGTHLPAPEGLRSPMEWGAEPRLIQLFGPHVRNIQAERRTFVFRNRSAEHWLDVFRTYYGPTHRAFAALNESGKRALAADLLGFLRRWNQHEDSPLCISSEYLEVVLTK